MKEIKEDVMRKKSLIILIILITIVFIISVIGYQFYQKIKNYGEQINQIEINEIDLSNIKDGEYLGEYKTIAVSAKVRISVKDHKITTIEILQHINGQGKAGEAVIEKVINQQTLKVDTISGATASSKVILKAIENALSKKE